MAQDSSIQKKLYFTNKICEFQDLIKIIHNFSQNSSYVYRGQSNSDWSILTSIENEVIRKKGINFFKSDLATKLKNHFERMIWEKVKDSEYSTFFKDSSHFFAFAQHYECKTRLLDVSKNIEKALFFTLWKKDNKSEDMALWIFPTKSFSKNYNFNHFIGESYDFNGHDELDFILFDYKTEDNDENERIKAQEGCFFLAANFRKSVLENVFHVEWNKEDWSDNDYRSLECQKLYYFNKSYISFQFYDILKKSFQQDGVLYIPIHHDLQTKIKEYLQNKIITEESMKLGRQDNRFINFKTWYSNSLQDLLNGREN